MSGYEVTSNPFATFVVTFFTINFQTHSDNVVINEFVPITELMPNEMRILSFNVYFNDSTQPISFEVLWSSDDVQKKATVSLKVTMGELVTPVSMSEAVFLREQGEILRLNSRGTGESSRLMFEILFAAKLKGMNEHTETIAANVKDKSEISQHVYEIANVTPISSSDASVLR